MGGHVYGQGRRTDQGRITKARFWCEGRPSGSPHRRNFKMPIQGIELGEGGMRTHITLGKGATSPGLAG